MAYKDPFDESYFTQIQGDGTSDGDESFNPDDLDPEDFAEIMAEFGEDIGDPFADDDLISEAGPSQPRPPPPTPRQRPEPTQRKPTAAKRDKLSPDEATAQGLDICCTQRGDFGGLTLSPSFILIIGPSQSGKTRLISDLIWANKTKYSRIFCFCKTLSSADLPFNPRKDSPKPVRCDPKDPKYKADVARFESELKRKKAEKLRTPYGFLEHWAVFNEFDEKDIENIIKEQERGLSNGRISRAGTDNHILIIIEDSIGMIKPNSKFWDRVSTSGRHSRVSFIIVSQKINKHIGTAMRTNSNIIYCTKLHGQDKADFMPLQGKYTDKASWFKYLDRNTEDHGYIRSDPRKGELMSFKTPADKHLFKLSYS